MATSKHKFYFTFPFNDKTTQFSKHYLSSLLLIDVQNTSRGFDFKNIVQILKTQRWKPEVCTSICTLGAEVWKIEKNSEGENKKNCWNFQFTSMYSQTSSNRRPWRKGQNKLSSIEYAILLSLSLSLSLSASLSTSSAYSASFFKHSPHVHTYVTSHEKNCFAGEMLKREPSVNNNGETADAS